MDPANLRLLVVTCAPDAATALLTTVLQEHLVACGNIIPGVRSHYWWDGQLCCDDEALIVLETTADRVDAAIARIAQVHSYAVPKVLAWTPVAGHAPYLAWVAAVTRPPG